MSEKNVVKASLSMLLLLLVLFIASCENKPDVPGNSTIISEIQQLTQIGGENFYSSDSINLNVFDRTSCKVELNITSLFRDTLADDRSLIFPILVTKKKVSFIEYPNSTYLNKKAELLEIKSKSGFFYYLASFPKDYFKQIAQISSSDSFQVKIKFMLNNVKGRARELVFPLGNTVNKATIQVLTDWKYLLDNPSYDLLSQKNTSETDLQEYPRGAEKPNRTYIANQIIGPNKLISLNTEISNSDTTKNRIKMIAILLFLIISVLYLKNEIFSLFKKIIRYPNYSKYSLEYIKLKMMPNRKKSASSDSPFDFDNSYVFKMLEESYEFGYQKAIEEMSPKSKWPTSIIFKIIVLTLIALLIFAATSFAQPNPQSCLIDDLQLRIKPEFDENSKLKLTTYFNMLILSADVSKKDQAIGVNFINAERNNDPEKITLFPSDLTYADRLNKGNYKILVNSKYIGKISKDKLKAIMLRASFIEDVNSSEDEVDYDSYNYINIEVPFKAYNYRGEIDRKKYFHLFPFDKRYIDVSLKFDQCTIIDSLSASEPHKFDSKGPYYTLDENGFPSDKEKSILKQGQSLLIKNGSPFVVTLELKRSWFLQFVIPVIMLGFAIFLGYILAVNDKVNKILANFLVPAMLFAIYKLIVAKFYPGIPNLLDLNGSFNISDIIMLLSVILFLITFKKFKKES